MSPVPPLRVAIVKASESATPERFALFLHGILGSGANWRTIARRFVQARPEWGAALVDLRGHGGSKGLSPPHTLDACVDDLVAIEATIPGPIRGIVAHSFGGKVALVYARAHAVRLGLERLWLVDSVPGARPDARGSENTLAVLHMLRALPPWFDTRQAFVDEVAARGQDLAIAQWLAMNLERGEHGVRFGLDLDVIDALLDDYFARDLWEVLASPPGALRIDVINGGRSNVYRPEDQARVAALAAASERVALHVIPRAGHWVHADAPEELLAILTA